MKTLLLKTSAGCILLAATLAIGLSLFASNPELIIRLTNVAGILITASMGLFVIGWAYPKDTPVFVEQQQDNQRKSS